MRWISDWRGVALMLGLLVALPIAAAAAFGLLASAGTVFAVAIVLGWALD